MSRLSRSLLLFLLAAPLADASPAGQPSSPDRRIAPPVTDTWDANAWEAGSGLSFWRKRPETARLGVPASKDSPAAPRQDDARRTPRSGAGSEK